MKFFTIATLFAAVALAVPTEDLIQDNEKRCEGIDCNVNTIVARDAEFEGDLAKRGGYYNDYDYCDYYYDDYYCSDYYRYGRGRGRFYGGRRYGHGHRGHGHRGHRGGHRGHRGGHRGHRGGRRH